jgi:hypothetical protein
MRKLPIKCSHGHRLFDAVNGSKLSIKIKCGNKKTCPHKANCLKQTEIIFGGEKDDFCGLYRHLSCPMCNKRIFDATKDSLGIVQIKCDHCGKVVDISLGMSA